MPNTATVSPSQEAHSTAPYVVPFVSFIALLAIGPYLDFLGPAEYPLRVSVIAIILFIFSRSVLDFRVRHLALSVIVGVAVWIIWVAPEVMFPGYRDHWIFQNPITGTITSSLDGAHRANWFVLFFRTIRAAVIVPIVEELFWRGWLLRWLQSQRFYEVPLGQWTWSSMVITAVLFASEHGAYWEVGLVAGFIYNWLIVRTKSLGDCIIAHGITNLCLSIFVMATGRWEFWM